MGIEKFKEGNSRVNYTYRSGFPICLEILLEMVIFEVQR